MLYRPPSHPSFDPHLPRIVEDTERRGPPGSGIVLALLFVLPFWAAVGAAWLWWPTVRSWAAAVWHLLRLVAL